VEGKNQKIILQFFESELRIVGNIKSLIYLLNQDYAEEDESDDLKMFFSSYSSFSV